MAGVRRVIACPECGWVGDVIDDERCPHCSGNTLRPSQATDRSPVRLRANLDPHLHASR